MVQAERKEGHSLSELHSSVDIPEQEGHFRRWLRFAGPAILVSVGYMDPGNWATDLAAGSRYNYQLIWVLLGSNVMAILLQTLSARLGIVRGLDLAQYCRRRYRPLARIPLWFLTEIAIIACDIAEVIGSALALNLLFSIPLLVGVVITIFDVLLFMALSNYGIRKVEAFILSLVGVIAFCLFYEVFLAAPDVPSIVRGLIPSIADNQALYIAIGILGATVMPHNLYLHSALVQTRKVDTKKPAKVQQALRYNLFDSVLSLNLAFFVNAAILVMAAAVFYTAGMHEVAEIEDAYKLLEPMLGSSIAPIAFALALLAAGQSSTLTGTLAGQIVMEGFLRIRLRPWIRRLLTRSLAAVPVLLAVGFWGDEQIGKLLIFSQVVLSLQLAFAVLPLIFANQSEAMGQWRLRGWFRIASWGCALLIFLLNSWLVAAEIGDMQKTAPVAAIILTLAALGALLLLAYLLLQPWLDPQPEEGWDSYAGLIHPLAAEAIESFSISLPQPAQLTAMIAIDFGGQEKHLIDAALQLTPGFRRLLLVHVTESPRLLSLGHPERDPEFLEDESLLIGYATALARSGITAIPLHGVGKARDEILRFSAEHHPELLILGTHGHTGVMDLALGATADKVRHQANCPVLLIPLPETSNG